MNIEPGTIKTQKRRWPMIAGISAGGVIGTLIILVLLTPVIISSGMIKKKIINNLEMSLNRKVQIEDIKMSWSTGLDIKQIFIREREDLPGDTFVKVNRIICNIDFIPLIKRQIRINDLIIDKPEIVVQKDKEGVFNYEYTGKPAKTVTTTGTAEKAVSDEPAESVEKSEYPTIAIPAFLFDLKIIARVNNGTFTFIDHQLQKETTIQDLNSTLNIDSLKNPIELKSTFDIETEGEKEHADISLIVSLARDGKIDPQNAKGTFNMKTGFASVVTDFDMSRFMGEGDTGLDFDMNVDLEKLTNNLAGMLGLPEGMHMEGNVSSRIKAEGQFEKTIGIDGTTEISNLSISGGPFGDKPLRQQNIKLVQKADIDITNDKVTIYKIGIDSNFLEMFLAGLITELRSTRNLNFKIFTNLDVTKLMSEIGGLLPEETEIAGQLQSNTEIKGRQNVMKLKGKIDLKNLYVKTGTEIMFTEPEITINHDVVYDIQNSDLELRNLSTNTSFAEMKTNGTVFNKKDVNLNLQLAGNIEKLTQNIQGIISLPEGLSVKGNVDTVIDLIGHIEENLKLSGSTTLLGLDATGGPLENRKISGLDLKLVHSMDYKITNDSLTIEQMDIESDFLKTESKGRIANLKDEKNLEYRLSMNMNLNKLTEKFAGVFPVDINMTGNGIVKLDINGKLSAQENENLYEQLNLDGNISIDNINYNAYEIRDFRSSLKLDDGFFTTKDFAFNLNGGTGTLTASADLNAEKPPLVIDIKLSDVNINQNMDILAYMVPVLAAPEGKLTGKLNMRFSAKGNGLNWQEDLSKNLKGEGEVDIKEGYIKGGKVTSKILKILGEEGEYKFDQITTRFLISDSKIHNDDISVNGEEFDIGLSGWTSFDGRLEYSANAEALGKYVGRDARSILKTISKDSKLPIVVTGTINSPKLDFKWPEPQEIGNILQGILGGTKDSRPQTENTGEQIETRETEKESKPPEKKEKENVVEKLFKDLFK